MSKKVVVIGSGFGGLAAALRLRAKNYNVTLLEKHSDLGGRARVFKKDNFTYDGGPTVITAPYLLQELFSLFNKAIEVCELNNCHLLKIPKIDDLHQQIKPKFKDKIVKEVPDSTFLKI